MNKSLFITIIALVCMISSPALSQNALFEGSVTDAETGDALMGANIIVSTKGELQTRGTASNLEGKFELPNIAPGEYIIRVSYLGYEIVVFENESFVPGESKFFQIAMTPGVIEAEQVIVSASLRREKILDAPASVSVIERAQIQNRQAITPIDHLIGLPGVDVVKTGLNQANVVVRGFNNVFSGSLLSIVDN